MNTATNKDEKIFYPDYEKGKGFYLIALVLSIFFFYLWIANKSIIFLFPGILFLFPVCFVIGGVYIGIKAIVIEKERIILIYRKKVIVLKTNNLDEIMIRNNGISSYIFNMNTVPIRITPFGYKNGEKLLQEFKSFFKVREKNIKIDDRRKLKSNE